MAVFLEIISAYIQWFCVIIYYKIVDQIVLFMVFTHYFYPNKEPLLTAISLSGFDVAVDIPLAVIFDELFQKNPDLKIILSEDETPDKWIRFVKDGALESMKNSWLQKILIYWWVEAVGRAATI